AVHGARHGALSGRRGTPRVRPSVRGAWHARRSRARHPPRARGLGGAGESTRAHHRSGAGAASIQEGGAMNSAEVYAVPARRALSTHYPWILNGLLWMVAFLNAADRSILVAVMPKLRDEFGLTPERLALINSVFFWIYAFAAFLSGRLGDSTRRSWVIVGGLAFWSVATGLVSLATGFSMLLALRGRVALGEGRSYPT